MVSAITNDAQTVRAQHVITELLIQFIRYFALTRRGNQARNRSSTVSSRCTKP